jgi:hypothetical protein
VSRADVIFFRHVARLRPEFLAQPRNLSRKVRPFDIFLPGALGMRLYDRRYLVVRQAERTMDAITDASVRDRSSPSIGGAMISLRRPAPSRAMIAATSPGASPVSRAFPFGFAPFM